MWIPVIEADQLGPVPQRVWYWGTPVVVFRTGQDGIGALEDVCPHRGVPLSLGQVQGDTLRCGFHHFRFSADGSCVDIPDEFHADQQLREACRVRSFYVKQVLGLIWISIEDEAHAPFPIDEVTPGSTQILATGSFEVAGDVRVWMDHFLDITHCIWAHAETAYAGSADTPAKLTSAVIRVKEANGYPIRRAIEMSFLAPGGNRRSTYSLSMRLLSSLAKWKAKLTGAGRPKDFRLHVRADLISPLCQETFSRLGPFTIRAITSITPVAVDKNRFVYAAIAELPPGASALARKLLRHMLDDFVLQHLHVEDGRFLAQATYLNNDRLQATEMDETVLAMRALFRAYQQAKAHLYPPGSLLRTLDYGEPPEDIKGGKNIS